MNHIPSPDNSDTAIERMIRDKGKVAPRVTSTDVLDNIVSAHYFTAAEGVIGAIIDQAQVNEEDLLLRAIAESSESPPALDLLTFCVLVLRNGFTVTGVSACASPENFDAEIGRRIARTNAENQIWPLMGYALKQQLHKEVGEPP